MLDIQTPAIVVVISIKIVGNHIFIGWRTDKSYNQRSISLIKIASTLLFLFLLPLPLPLLQCTGLKAFSDIWLIQTNRLALRSQHVVVVVAVVTDLLNFLYTIIHADGKDSQKKTRDKKPSTLQSRTTSLPECKA